ncbi:ATP-dependent Lon protease/hypothetical protein [Abditibacterium utsteinense]|uniref:Lon N-terminal domain-containing protein n=1 Tax=Abditibacterium utsteinense TaxID=1960156 RepID=A0A2S8SXI0_9BACT|nr:LON peptidase substrate-binding domain-containing protein [Abditibacterium utsteinense]PQV65507.1 ATP-dependent Lon protease/hypothetical protein [Abditibacterium utsteinense]
MSFEIPLFPLNVVLFPGMPLPLHIFEPRYRLMIGRCMEGERTFGVAQMAEGVEGMSATTAMPVGTVAEIIEVEPFADGRMNVQTVGTRRFEILSTRQQDDYLMATCDWLEDEIEGDLSGDATRARHTLSRYFDSLAVNTELPADLGDLDVPNDPFALSMFIAAIMSLPDDQKQQLLEMTSTRNRLQLEEFLLERADIVQRAFSKHAAMGHIQPPIDHSLGQFSGFISPN